MREDGSALNAVMLRGEQEKDMDIGNEKQDYSREMICFLELN